MVIVILVMHGDCDSGDGDCDGGDDSGTAGGGGIGGRKPEGGQTEHVLITLAEILW